MNIAIRNLNKGFSLVEILVSLSIFLIFINAIGTLTVNSSKQARHSVNKERASALAEEGLEASRNIRDVDFANLTTGTHGISTSGNQFNLSGLSDTNGIFSRTVTISPIGGEQKKVDVAVSWADQISQNNLVTLSTYLTNWRAIINNGLTISKNVVNHGGSLQSSDFLPINLDTTSFDNSVDPPVLQNINIPIVFSPSTMNLLAGTYTFSTTNSPNYELTLSPDCGNGSIVLNNQDAKICIINYEEYVVPTVTTPTAASITDTSATIGANVTFLGVPGAISVRGTCWGTTPAPTTNCAPQGGTTTGAFTQARTGFTGGTLYYYRGYATNYTGTGYSEDGTFTTAVSGVVPTVASPTATGITAKSATLGANVTSLGNPASITARGICYGTTPAPITNCTPQGGTTAGIFTQSVTSLNRGTKYYYRGYATNSAGTGYSEDGTFTTLGSSISFVGASSNAGTTITIPAHQAGDLLVMFAYRDGSASAPSLPAGWTNIGVASGASSNSSRLAYRVSTDGNTLSGTWTSATGLVVHVYRGQNISTPIGAQADNGGSNSTVIYPALTMTQIDGSSWAAGFAGHRSTNTNLQTPPIGMNNRTNFVNGTNEVSGHDTGGSVSSWSATSVSVGGTASGWRARTLEILSQ